MTQMVKKNPSDWEQQSPSLLMGEGWGEGVLLSNAKRLRAHMTDAERRLWQQLRAKRFAGFKFRRQVPLGHYILDFVSYNPRLIIELDGSQHAMQSHYDRTRDAFFAAQGFQILRFWNNDIMENEEGVLATILNLLRHSPLPNPLPQGEREFGGAA